MSGRYEFASASTDEIYNTESLPLTPDAVVIVNAYPDQPMILDVPPGDSELVFPLTDDLDVTITLTGVQSTGTLSLLRRDFAWEILPPYFRYPDDLFGDSLQIVEGGGLLAGGFTATMEWGYNPIVEPAKGINRVYRFEGNLNSPTGIYTVSTIGHSGKLRVTGIDHFSTWWAGNADACPEQVSRFTVE